MRAHHAILLLVCAIGCRGAESNGVHVPGAHDWPQWRGPDRNDVNKETGLLRDWPKDGPEISWKAKGLGGGYSTPSVAAGRVFGMGFVDDDEVVWALDEKSGEMLWSKAIAAKNAKYGYGEGSRSTPTVVDDVLYTLGIDGDLVCLKVSDGELVWHVNLKKEYGGQVGGWGYSESPLVDGDKVVVAAGGTDATIVALDRKRGNLIWKSKSPRQDQAHYASAIVAEAQGVRQYITFLSGGVVAVAADDGRCLWSYDKPHNGTANCSTPIFNDGHVFAASNYGTGGGLVSISAQDGKFSVTEVYFTKNMKNHHGGMVLVNGFIYGCNDPGLLTCLDFKTGELKWDERKPGKGSVAYADGRLYCRNESSGDVVLVEANPEKYIEHGRLKQPDRSGHNAWPHPVIANGRLYLRDQEIMIVYDVKEKK
jgi:outer membrane protein assembly factor BamB